jgi:hypothetical protein
MAPKTKQEYASLYALAQKMSSDPPVDLQELGRGVVDATDRLVSRVCKGLERKVQAAATVGSTHMDLCRFQGNDLEEESGFPMLTLIKGPRDPDLQPLCGPNLLQRLRVELAPFKVQHVWHTRSNVNRLVLSWEEEMSSESEEEDISSSQLNT